MINAEFVHQLTPEQIEYFDQLEPAYSIALDRSSELIVTPEAHDFYGFTPRVDTTPGRLALAETTQPLAHIVFAAPTEFGPTKLLLKDLFYDVSPPACRFALTVPQTPEEYMQLGHADYCKAMRASDWRSRSDQQILADMEPAVRTAMDAELRAGQIADFVHMLAPQLGPRLVQLREQSFAKNPGRQQLLDRQGMALTVINSGGAETFEAMPKAVKYGMKRAEDICRQVFRVFCGSEHDFLLKL